MKKTNLIACLIACCTHFSIAQTNPCALDLMRPNQVLLWEAQQVLDDAATKHFRAQSSPDFSNETVTIPVVVHIIHDNGLENIPDAQVEQAIQWLNESFANQGYFDQNSGAVTGIQFCLAKQKPDGSATNGIVRVQSALYTDLDIGSEDLGLKNTSRWNPSKYINIWVIKEGCYQGNCGVAGYAYPPAYHGNSYDGLVVEAKFFGTDPWKIALATHEMGHYFGLLHTFEGGCINTDCLVNGDKVCDTPPDNSTASVACNTQVNTCNTDAQSGFSSDQQDLTNNYLDYNSLLCTHDFTQGQSDRMQFFLNGTRQSLLGSSGCDLPCPLTVNAAFTPSDLVVELGATVSFTNTSQNASTYIWKVNGQQFSTDINPTYQFNQVGIFTIVLAAESSNTLCDVDFYSKNIIVNCNTMADFTVSALTVEAGETITITNTSTNATQYEWFVNGISQGSTFDAYTLPSEGIYYIRLVATNGSCSDERTIIVEVPGICTDYAFRTLLPESVVGCMTVLADSTIVMGLNNIASDKNLIKINNKGEVIYTKKLVNSGIGDPITPRRLDACDDGGFIGSFEYTAGLVTIGKFNTEGNAIWASSVVSSLTISDAIAAPGGGAYVLSSQYLTKVHASGNVAWQIAINSNIPFSAQRIHPAKDGSVFVTGTYSLILNFIIKINANGEIVWQKSILSTDAPIDFRLVAEDTEENVYIASTQNHILKLTPAGTKIWARQYPELLEIISIAPAENGVCLSAMLTVGGNDNCMVGLSGNGDITWGSYAPENLTIYDLESYLNTGYIALTEYIGNAYILKTNSIGRIGDCNGALLFDNIVNSSNISVSNGLFSLDTQIPTTINPATILSFDRTQSLTSICAPTCIPSELCFNNLDDDGDGLADCLDSDCICDDLPCENKADENWYFGENAGLNFATSPPTVLTDGKTNAFPATSTISDVQGNLLFYAGMSEMGIPSIFNRFHEPMPGYVFSGNESSAEWQIVPHPTKKYLYYAFARKSSYGYGIKYHLIDMRLDEGKGGIVAGFSNIQLLTSERMTGIYAIESCDFDGYWLIAKDWFDTRFWAFKIDENGLQTTPVISNILTIPYYKMDCSSDGSTIAFSTGSKVVLYNFNKSTGTIQFQSEYDFLVPISSVFGFSPNGKLLYLNQSISGSTDFLQQFDLSSGDSIAVVNSGFVLSNASNFGSYLSKGYLAPDNKMYFGSFTSSETNKLGVIHQPNVRGEDCYFQQNAISLGDMDSVHLGLCNTIRRNNAPIEAYIKRPAPDTICISEPAIDYTYFARNIVCSTDSVDWKIEGLNAVFVQKEAEQATLKFLGGGSGRLILTAFAPCGISADTLSIFITKSTEKVLDLGGDISICELNAINLKAETGFTKYKWNNGSTDSTIIALVPGKYWVDVWDDCGNKQTDTINVILNPTSSIGLGADMEACKNTVFSFQRPDDIIAWNWSPFQDIPCDTCQTITLSPTQTTTWEVTGANQYGCVTKDFLKITVVNTISIAIDTAICVKDQILLFGNLFPSDTMASIFLPTDGSGCDTLLMVTVSPKKAEIAIVPTEKTIKIGDVVEIKTTLSGASPFDLTWSPPTYLTCTDCLEPISEPLQNITYLLSVTDQEGCVTEGSVKITVVDSCALYIPNVFSPNGDKRNDVFYPSTDPCVKIVYSWRIINRWGDLVFESLNFPPNDENYGWDGRVNGQESPTDTYIWTAEWGYYDGRKETKKGDLTLIR